LSKISFQSWNFEWEVIKYKDQKSLFDSLTNNNKEVFFGHLKNDNPEKMVREFEEYSIYVERIIEDGNIGFYLPLFSIKFENKHKEYLLYKRKKLELLDVLANIGALFSTIKYFFSLVFSFYSKNFDNYKILETILNSSNKSYKRIELRKSFNASLSGKDKNENNLINDINNFDSLIDVSSTENNLNINNDDNDDEDNENIFEDSSIAFKKLHFYDFFFNNIYSKCCIRIKNQEILNRANDIIFKYLSIDYLLYNQIMLEHLFKDYKWSNPLLNKIKNHEMFIKLKNS